MEPGPRISIILPAKNEAEGLRQTLPALRERFPGAEVIVVDDGSSDGTALVARGHDATTIASPYSMGNGAAIKRGTRAASGDILVFMSYIPAASSRASIDSTAGCSTCAASSRQAQMRNEPPCVGSVSTSHARNPCAAKIRRTVWKDR